MTKSFPYLTHPVVLFALILTAINDHYLKYQFHNYLTGKISDFSGLFFFPLFLYGITEFIKSPMAAHSLLKKNKLIIMIVVTDALFIIFKFSTAKHYLSEIFNLKIISDYSDIMALSVNTATYFFAKKYFITELK